MDIKVYTAVFGEYDRLKPYPGICFTDKAQDAAEWEYRIERFNTIGPRRCARQHKCLSHMFVDAEYTIWHDANLRLKLPPEAIIKEYLPSGYDMSLGRHPFRDCIYEEAEEVKRLGVADPRIVDLQMYKYRRNGYPEHHGLVETGIVIRRHSAQIKHFNVMWWLEIANGACRDQLSFNYVAWKYGVPFHIMRGRDGRWDSELFEYQHHKKESQWMML
jgi:hypothetical protein